MIDYGIGLASFGMAYALTYLFSGHRSVSLFFCLAAVAITASYCTRIPRLLVTALTILFTAFQLPPSNSLAISSAYMPLFIVYVVVCLVLCLGLPARLRQWNASRYTQVLTPPDRSPEETLNGPVKEQAIAQGDVTIPKEAVYHWMREFAHLRDLIWNIDDSWRRRDWKQLAVSIKLAYKQAAQTEQAMLKAGADAFSDPADQAEATQEPDMAASKR